MASRNRIIIDTDPGVDDILAILLALTARPEEVEVLLLSVGFGNVDVESCLRNILTTFHVIDRELEWRRQRGLTKGFDSLMSFRPLVAVGPEKPLADQLMMADYFHGIDGLGGIHASHPHFTPEETWKMLFKPLPEEASAEQKAAARELASPTFLMRASQLPAHKEILRILRENKPGTITIVAIGPLTNLALAAAEEPETFLRVKELVVMGGAIDIVGNVTPTAEFNISADAVAAARIFALTSPLPSSTLPPSPPPSSSFAESNLLPPYPYPLSRMLNLSLFPLDITTSHVLKRAEFESKVQPLVEKGSPLAQWVMAFVSSTFRKIDSLHEGVDGLSLHDPLCIWYILTQSSSTAWLPSPQSPPKDDIRIETTGQWTRGMCVVDRRTSRRRPTTEIPAEEILGDAQGWLSLRTGNRIRRIVATPGADVFASYLLDRIFGGSSSSSSS